MEIAGDDQPPDNPRWDPGFVDRCLVDLMQHWGRYRRLGQLYASKTPSFERCLVIREAVEWGRRLGMVIESDRGQGYRIVDFQHPAAVYLLKPGRPPRDEAEVADPRQLTFASAGIE